MISTAWQRRLHREVLVNVGTNFVANGLIAWFLFRDSTIISFWDAEANFDVTETIRELEEEMIKAADNLEFEKAALLRDQIQELKRSSEGTAKAAMIAPGGKVSYGKGRKRT